MKVISPSLKYKYNRWRSWVGVGKHAHMALAPAEVTIKTEEEDSGERSHALQICTVVGMTVNATVHKRVSQLFSYVWVCRAFIRVFSFFTCVPMCVTWVSRGGDRMGRTTPAPPPPLFED